MAKVKKYKNPDRTVRGNWHVLAFQKDLVVKYAKIESKKLKRDVKESEMVRKMIMYYDTQKEIEDVL